MRRFLSLALLCCLLLGVTFTAQAQSTDAPSRSTNDAAALELLEALDVDSYTAKAKPSPLFCKAMMSVPVTGCRRF
ncbi:hypothetical protein HORIV_68050 [Vreelandella olivaria]|uniref:Uncharacterized protein n=1 Tax=Vreelandella olivaria TaxID=390919 RepID=A0ABN5X553_9GAMM|nr:hypothetical protein HORIV_68050 [Halomonas olivaria]